MKFFDAHQPPFSLHGLVQEPGYRRLPESMLDSIRPPLKRLAQQTSGGRIRFATDANEMVIRITLSDTVIKTHMTPLNMAGAELYAGAGAQMRRVALFRPLAEGAGTVPFEKMDGYGICRTSEHTINLSGTMETYTLYLPIFAAVEEVLIGLPEAAALLPAQAYAVEKPIVFYGSSITHGACAGRPSLTYPARVCASLDADFINLGFAGNALGDLEIAAYIAGLDMSAFVLDYDWNAPTPEFLFETHKPFFDAVRSCNPGLEILIISRFESGHRPVEDTAARFEVICKTHEAALKSGDRHVTLLDGRTFFDPQETDLCLMDFIHPNDYGFHRMAEKILPVLTRMLEQG